MALFCAVLLLSSCNDINSSRKQTDLPFVRVSEDTTIAECWQKAGVEAEKGHGLILLRADDNRDFSMEFPLVDNNEIHWQFEAVNNIIKRNDDRPGTHLISSDRVLWIKFRDGKWETGMNELLEDKRLIAKILAINDPKVRMVVICEVSENLRLGTLAPIWLSAQKHNIKFYPFLSKWREDRDKSTPDVQ